MAAAVSLLTAPHKPSDAMMSSSSSPVRCLTVTSGSGIMPYLCSHASPMARDIPNTPITRGPPL
eukprot:356232-Chlamydomonas_euryale.AAC.24